MHPDVRDLEEFNKKFKELIVLLKSVDKELHSRLKEAVNEQAG